MKDQLNEKEIRTIKKVLKEAEGKSTKAQKAVELLAKYLGLKANLVRTKNTESPFIVETYLRKYKVFENEEQAEEEAIELMENYLEEDIELAKDIRFKKLGISISDYVSNEFLNQCLDDYVNSMDDEELAELGVADSVDAGDKILEGYDNIYDWLSDMMGDRELQKLLIKHKAFNYRKLAEDIVNYDGREKILSEDGKEIELDDGYLAYRIN